MTEIGKNRQRTLVWSNLLFFGITSLLALVALPVYVYKVGLVPQDWWIFGVMAVATMMATTFGYHRLFAHRAFKAHPVVVFLNLFFGAGAFGGSAMVWASDHRNHHRFTDTFRDPYNIKEGFWHAHMGWFLFHRHPRDFSNIKDLASNRMTQHQHDHYTLWAIASGIAMPLLLGYLLGSFWGAFFLGVCGRLFFIHQSIFLINSACHMFGKATYSLDNSARDSFLMAIFTHGEGYHSFHHRFPSDYRNGVRWYQWDPTKWLVRLLNFIGLTSGLQKTAELRMLSARGEVEQQRLILSIQKSAKPRWMEDAVKHVNDFYESLRFRLKVWEEKQFEYRTQIQHLKDASREMLHEKAEQVRQAKEDFLHVRREWLKLVERYSLLLQVNPAKV